MEPEGIYFIPGADSEGHFAIHFFNFCTAKDVVVQGLNGIVSEGLAVSPNGEHLLFTPQDEQRSDLMLVRDFR